MLQVLTFAESYGDLRFARRSREAVHTVASSDVVK